MRFPVSDMVTWGLRLPSDLRAAFEHAASSNDQSASQLVRAFMRDYVAKHAQLDLLKPVGRSSVKGARKRAP